MRKIKWDRIDERNFYETCRNNIIKRENVHYVSQEPEQNNQPDSGIDSHESQDDTDCSNMDLHSQAERNYQEQLITEILQPGDSVTPEQIEQIVKNYKQ